MANGKNPSHKKKGPGRRLALVSKQPKRTKQQTQAARATHSWRARVRGYKKEIAIRQGETIVPMAARILLMMTLSFALETGSVVNYTANRGFEGMMTVYRSVNNLTGVSVRYLKGLFESLQRSCEGTLHFSVADSSIRGRGSPNVDKQKLRKLTKGHLCAIENFITHCNSEDGCGFVSSVYILHNMYK